MGNIRIEGNQNISSVQMNAYIGKLDVLFRIKENNFNISISNNWFILKDGQEVKAGDRVVKHVKTYEIPYPRIGWTEEYIEGGVVIDYYLEVPGGARGAMSLSAVVANRGKEKVSLIWKQKLGDTFDGMKVFGPTGKSFYNPAVEDISLSYRGGVRVSSINGICMPLVTLFDENKDIGISIAGNIEIPILPFKFTMNSKEACGNLERRTLDIEPGKAVTLRQYYIGHEGCWRPGLSWVRDRFPRFFMLPDEKLVENHGCFTYSTIADKEMCKYMSDEGVTYLEIHGSFNHYGKYVPDSEPWTMNSDDKWCAIKLTTDPEVPPEESFSDERLEYLKKVVKVEGTVNTVNEFIKNLKEVGIQSYIYFQPTECWESYARKYFPESINYLENGLPSIVWFENFQMDCRTGTRWGEYLCRQMEMLVDMYPDLDGVFMDQAAEDWLWDDYAVSSITKKLAQIVESRGKRCYWNGPYQVELIEHAIGFLAEGGSSQAELIKFLTIGNKICCGMGHTELQYQRNLVNGLWPSVPSIDIVRKNFLNDLKLNLEPLEEDRVELHKRYMPLYELYKGKTWVLEPHALKVCGSEMEGNIFELPNKDYIVPLIIPGRSYEDGIYECNATITVRTSNIDRIKRVYVRTPDTPGLFALDWEREAGTIKVTIPWFGSACLLWFSGEEQECDEFKIQPMKGSLTARPRDDVMMAYIIMEGVVRDGSKHAVYANMKTTAPLPPIPERKAWFNGKPATINIRNYMGWHQQHTIGLDKNILEYLKEENEVIIEPASAQDFFKLRNLKLEVVLANGQIIKGESPSNEVYSSCVHPKAEGIVGSPLKIKIRIPEYGK